MHARNFTTNVPKILDLKSSSEQIFSRKLSLGAPDFNDEKRNKNTSTVVGFILFSTMTSWMVLKLMVTFRMKNRISLFTDVRWGVTL